MGQRDRDGDSGQPLQQALAAVEALGATNAVVVPATPSARMLVAGGLAGGVSNEIAARIYHAMILVGGR
jgi:hypothetical protein